MVISTSDNLRTLFEKLKSVGFFGRLFRWRRILEINAAAGTELTTLTNELDSLNDQNRQTKNQLRSVYQDLDHQKSLLSDLKSDYAIVKTSNLYMSQTIKEKEVEIGAVRESEAKNTKRIAEMERESDRLRSTIEQYIQQVRKNEGELGALRESSIKNRERIIEFERDAERTRAAIEEYTQKIQDCKSEISALTEADAKNTKRILELEKDTERYRHSMKQYIRHLEGDNEGKEDRNEPDTTIKE
jgi:chromosome segregation ATPase